MEPTKILITEDDPNLGLILSEYLTLKGYSTVLCPDGEVGLKTFQEQKFDLCILDLMMPKKDGFTLASDIREKDQQTPIIFLTAKSMQEDVLNGFKVGGDDYMTKPFSMEELLLRIKAVLKRSSSVEKETEFPIEYKLGNITYYYKENRLIKLDGEVKLTTKENELLKLFFENLNNTLDRSIALKKIWKDDSYFNARSMDVYIAKLRKHLKTEEKLKILTIHGEGFRMVQVN
jgi:two-component system response regulator VicR